MNDTEKLLKREREFYLTIIIIASFAIGALIYL